MSDNKEKEIVMQRVLDSDTDKVFYQKLSSMYEDYVGELHEMSEGVEEKQHLISPEYNTVVSYNLIKMLYTSEYVGFVMYSRYPNSFAKHDLYVGELYILPRFRRKGHATKTMEMLIEIAEEDDLDISFDILKQNIAAKKTAKKIMEKRGYTERFKDGALKVKVKTNKDLRFFYYTKQ